MAIDAACCITFANTSEKWFKKLMAFPQCFIVPRVHYINGQTRKVQQGTTKGSVVTYLGWDLLKFREAFSNLGVVKV